ncbi:MAG: ABC transporter permease, partial [Saprospiraceae bacterium]
MLTNYFKLALRNLLKNKMYTGINLVGLSIGIAATILIYRIITYELSYNKHFKNYDRIVRVIVDGKNKITGNHYQNQGMTLPAMDVIKRSVPQFKTTTKIKEFWPTIAVP